MAFQMISRAYNATRSAALPEGVVKISKGNNRRITLAPESLKKAGVNGFCGFSIDTDTGQLLIRPPATGESAVSRVKPARENVTVQCNMAVAALERGIGGPVEAGRYRSAVTDKGVVVDFLKPVKP